VSSSKWFDRRRIWKNKVCLSNEEKMGKCPCVNGKCFACLIQIFICGHSREMSSIKGWSWYAKSVKSKKECENQIKYPLEKWKRWSSSLSHLSSHSEMQCNNNNYLPFSAKEEESLSHKKTQQQLKSSWRRISEMFSSLLFNEILLALPCFTFYLSLYL